MTSSRREAGDVGSGVWLLGLAGSQAPHLALAAASQPPTAAVKLWWQARGGRVPTGHVGECFRECNEVWCERGTLCRVGTGFVSSAGLDCSQLSLHWVPQLTSYALVNSRSWYVRFDAFCSAICLNYMLIRLTASVN